MKQRSINIRATPTEAYVLLSTQAITPSSPMKRPKKKIKKEEKREKKNMKSRHRCHHSQAPFRDTSILKVVQRGKQRKEPPTPGKKKRKPLFPDNPLMIKKNTH